MAQLGNAQRIDPLTPEQRSQRMALIRGRNTEPELVVRRLAWSMGYRYRLHRKQLPGRPDLVFTNRHKVVFIHGCFWHQHKRCKQYVMPKTRLEFWLPKLYLNVVRDVRNKRKLQKAGWKVLTLWECELKNKQKLSERLQRFLEGKSK
jgi:DNA mismatch endonuclease, patch repair protein